MPSYKQTYILGMIYFPLAVCLVFIPSELFYYNMEEWGGDIFLIGLPAIISIFLLATIIAIYLTIKKIKPALADLVKPAWLLFNLGIIALFCDTLAPIQLSQLDGSNIRSSQPLSITLIELCIIASVFAFYFKGKKYFETCGMVSLFFIAFSFLYLSANIYLSTALNVQTDNKTSVSTNNDHLPNIYHFHLDAMQTDFFLEDIEQSNTEAFDGFTLFEKNIANYPYSLPSIASYLTSTTFSGEHYIDWINNADQGLYTMLSTAGYNLNVFGKRPLLYSPLIDNFESGQDIYKAATNIKHPMLSQFSSLLAGRILPNAITNRALSYGKKIGNLYPQRSDLPQPKTIADGIEPYTGTLILKHAIATEHQRKNSGEYLLIQPVLPHGPYFVDDNCNYGITKGTFPQRYSLQVSCANKLVAEFIDELKRLGRYENSIFIIHGDHGSGWAGFTEKNRSKEPQKSYRSEIHPWSQKQLESRAFTLLMIKANKKSTSPFFLNQRKTTLLDIYPTIASMLNLSAPPNAEGYDLTLCLKASCAPAPGSNQNFFYFPPGKNEKQSIEKIPLIFINGKPSFDLDKTTQRDIDVKYSYKGSDLPSQSGEVVGSSRVIYNKKSPPSYITYGPYIQLKPGRYSYSMMFSSSLPQTESAAKFDVRTTNTQDNALKELVIYGSNNETASTEGEFIIPPGAMGKNARTNIEARMYYLGQGDFSVISLEFKKLDN
ncbi:hypothetical protein SIN8267_02125 [Sinobacterium norvegicum]|uniref:Sulfatase N-terminal domain-containing protein n=1 Tax=Sinobacterium norvegicum TaxID=1641715 RepID=A0ABM9AG90_9GAMM|nr:sulfatase-like hydrolase/transferase [Sinobacterium norvegicum]CAH0992010.1 hypothetical protein SIN8267_02125 [Sinobacterium norvegicum]